MDVLLMRELGRLELPFMREPASLGRRPRRKLFLPAILKPAMPIAASNCIGVGW